MKFDWNSDGEFCVRRNWVFFFLDFKTFFLEGNRFGEINHFFLRFYPLDIHSFNTSLIHPFKLTISYEILFFYFFSKLLRTFAKLFQTFSTKKHQKKFHKNFPCFYFFFLYFSTNCFSTRVFPEFLFYFNLFFWRLFPVENSFLYFSRTLWIFLLFYFIISLTFSSNFPLDLFSFLKTAKHIKLVESFKNFRPCNFNDFCMQNFEHKLMFPV